MDEPGHAEARAALVRRYLRRNGDKMSLRKIADDLFLTVAQVSLALDELQAEERAAAARDEPK